MAKLAGEAGSEAIKTTNGLLQRVIGPSLDVLGSYWAERMTDYVNDNRRRIAERAIAKSAGESGFVHPRVAFDVLERGSYVGGPLAAEYFGGLLAASRTPDGDDDAGVALTGILASMSQLQIRAHFIIYREWAALLKGTIFHLGNGNVRKRDAALLCDPADLASAIGGNDADQESTLQFALAGLLRLGLIDAYEWGKGVEIWPESPPYDPIVAIAASPSGF